MANVSKNVRAAKKTFDNITELQELVNKDAVPAYEAMSKLAFDPAVNPATRAGILDKILKLHWLYAQAAEKLMGEPANREEERKQEVGKGVVAEFRRFPVAV